MHHIYSLRPGRPETAASAENPLAPVSVAKSSRFIKNNIGHALRKSTGGVMAPDLAKKLAKLIAMEKNTLRSLETASKERKEGAEALSVWAAEQEDDVSDVVDKVAVLLSEVSVLEDQYVDRYDQYRIALKSIRDIEKDVDAIRGKKEKIADDILKLKNDKEDTPENATKLESLENELVRVEAEALVAEAQLYSITHEKIKSGLRYQFAAMQELGEKMALISGFGNHLLDLMHEGASVSPDEEPKPYEGREASIAIVEECEKALTTWVGSQAAVSADLSKRTQSMISSTTTGSVTGKAADQQAILPAASKPRAVRRWSSDEEYVETATSKEEIGLAA